jgi:hypothetical protein
MEWKVEGQAASKTSHAGIIRIGFEGISQPHFVEHPCFNSPIETPRAIGMQMDPVPAAENSGEKHLRVKLGPASQPLSAALV